MQGLPLKIVPDSRVRVPPVDPGACRTIVVRSPSRQSSRVRGGAISLCGMPAACSGLPAWSAGVRRHARRSIEALDDPLGPVPVERYGWFLSFAAPTINFAGVLGGSVAAHGILRALRRESDLGFLVNISGMCASVIGAFIVVWDWSWLAAGFYSQYFLGITHIMLETWAMQLPPLAMKRRLGVPIPLGVGLSVVGIAAALALAVPFMRSPF